MSTFSCVPFAELHAAGVPTLPVAGILGVPTDAMSTARPGARDAPRAIRSVDYPDTLTDVVDFGDVGVVYGDAQATGEATQEAVQAMTRQCQLPVVLGGDDSINYWVGRGLVGGAIGSNVLLVHFDAHADTQDSEEAGTVPDHATWLRDLTQEGYVPQALLVGNRCGGRPCPRVTEMKLDRGQLSLHLTRVTNMTPEKRPLVWLSIDMDVFDPAFAPGVSVPEPFGLGPREFLAEMEPLFDRIGVLSITEVNPAYDRDSMTATLANRIVAKVIASRIRKK